ncbi:MAG: DUF3147 family protein [Rhodospirillales bacterium]
MFYLALKTVVSAVIIVAVSEIAKRSPLFAGLVASLPLVSVLAIVWLYADTRNPQQVIDLSRGILLMILPSLIFFIVLPAGLKLGVAFVPALLAAIFVTAAAYWGYTVLLARFGITL